jgi:hypothetical protein
MTRHCGKNAIKPLLSEQAVAALAPGRHSLTISELVLLLKLELIKPTGRTADGRVTCYSLTGNGRILAQTVGER